MPVTNDLVQLGRRVAATHGWAQAKAFKAYVWDEQDRSIVAASVREIFKLFPQGTGHENSLHATLAFQLRRRLKAPVHLVAGTLGVEGVTVRGDRLPADGVSPFAPGAPEWRGHVWIMAGPYVIDAGIFRIAKSVDCPSVLARHVHSVFGQDKGLYADHWRQARRVGLEYDPLYVLSDADTDKLLEEARAVIDGSGQ